MLENTSGHSTDARLTDEASTPWNWPCRSSATCRVASDCRAGAPMPPRANTGMMAKIIQLRVAKAMTTRATQAQAMPPKMVTRSPSSFTAGPGRKAWASAWHTPKAPSDKPIHSPFHSNASWPHKAQHTPYTSPAALKVKKMAVIGSKLFCDNTQRSGRNGFNASRSIFSPVGRRDSGNVSNASSRLPAFKMAAAMNGRRNP